MHSIITIDVGGSSMRGTLFDFYGKKLETKQIHYTPEFSNPGLSEQDPQSWIKGLEEILSFLGRSKKTSIDCIAVTAARSSVISVNKEGRHLSRAIMWQDRRTTQIVEDFRDMHGYIYDTTGIRFSTMVSAPKIIWMRQQMPELYARTSYFLGIQDFLIHKLTGNFVTDHSFGSRTAIMDIAKKCWNEDLLQLYELDEEKLCQLIEPGSICGTLDSSLARRIGIPSGIPVVSAGGDQQCAALGQGIFTEKDMLVSTGTGAYLIQGLGKVVKDSQQRFTCNVAAIPNRYILEASILTAGSIYRWFADLFFGDKRSSGYASINTEIEKSPIGARGVLLLPWFEGRGSPSWNPHACGALHNLSLGTTLGDIGRAILEGIALELKENADAMESLTEKVSEIKSTGGMSMFDLYNQILADCFGKTMTHTGEGESTIAGAWMGAMVALGIVSDHREAFERLKETRTEKHFRAIATQHQLYQEIFRKRQSLCKN